MKLLLTLLLLIPSLSWGEVIPLYCELKKFEYKEKNKENWLLDEYATGNWFFYFDSVNKNITMDLGVHKKEFYLTKELEKSYEFKYRNIQYSDSYYETIKLNKYSYRIYLEGFREDQPEAIRKLECVIKDKIL